MDVSVINLEKVHLLEKNSKNFSCVIVVKC